jgi:pyrroloquinoline quinone (PQQ) biosynthesis protein C
MSFFQTLQDSTELERSQLLDCALVHDALEGRMSTNQYVAFLCQAFHHVKHTVPLMMAAGSRLPQNKEWLRVALLEYAEEEIGHQEWILNDIAACGYDPEKARHSVPNPATEVMIAYAYHTIDRVNPVGFFGMVHVLEGTSISVADHAAARVRESTGLPEKAFSYLTSHCALDVKHVKFFQDLMSKIDDVSDQQAIVHCARLFYKLYGDVYRSIESHQSLQLAA